MDKNLVTIINNINQINELLNLKKQISLEEIKKLDTIKERFILIGNVITKFNEYFAKAGWCAYAEMNFDLMKNCVETFEENNSDEKDALERVDKLLCEFYSSQVYSIKHWIKNSSEAFRQRYELINLIFEDHLAKRYYSSIPLALIVADGAVNDFTSKKGFFVENANYTVWDSIIGCSEGLNQIKILLNKSRQKTTTDVITVPYRNGILHGRDLNYANELVSSKCIALLFAIASWMKDKSTENDRRNVIEKSEDIFTFIRQADFRKKRDEDFIRKWNNRKIKVKYMMLENSSENYQDIPYLKNIINAMDSWKNKNYGELGVAFYSLFGMENNYNRRAKICRMQFEDKIFKSYEIVDVNEKSPFKSEVLVEVKWCKNEIENKASLKFNCIHYWEDDERSDTFDSIGTWKLIILNPSVLFK